MICNLVCGSCRILVCTVCTSSVMLVIRREDTVFEELHLDVATLIACAVARLVFLSDEEVHDSVC